MSKLLEKYNTPVPRYTSYPPANFFTEQYTAKQYLQDVEVSNNQQPENISVYIHIPFCSKLCFYCGCNSYPLAKATVIDDYMAALLAEIKLVSGLWDKKRKISQIHYGGGTPNVIDFTYLQRINDYLFSNFELIDAAEIAIECSPAHLTHEYIRGLQQAGFNRCSLGIQDFDERVLKASNREISTIPIKELVGWLRSGEGAMAVNFDFIYGLPYQTPESFARTIQQATDYSPDRLVTFSYAHVPWVNANQRKLEKLGLPLADDKMAMYKSASQILKDKGYYAVGLDHFVLPADELYMAQQALQLHRNFQGYCTRRTTGQVYAFGVSGISQLAGAYSQNTKVIADYITALQENRPATVKGYTLNETERLIRTIVTELMCNHKFTWEQIAVQNKMNKQDIQRSIVVDTLGLQEMQADGLLEYSTDGLEVNDEGKPFIRNIAAIFDPLVKSGGKQFSKTV